MEQAEFLIVYIDFTWGSELCASHNSVFFCEVKIFLEVNHQQDATQLQNFYYSTHVNSSNMFRALCLSSSGTSTVLEPLVYKHLWRPAVVPSEWELRLRRHHGRSPQTRGSNAVEVPDDERHNAQNMFELLT
jgi:hypothetical protein